MRAVLFNIHDVALIVTVIACALLGFKQFGGWSRPKRSGALFGLFLTANALVALNALILWAEPVRHTVFTALPYLYFFLGAANFLLGPLLYWQLKTHLNPEFRLGPAQFAHLVPALLALAYLYAECFRFPHEVQRDLLLNLQLYQQPGSYYNDFISLSKLLPLGYGLLCLGVILRHALASGRRISEEGIQFDQLYIVGGFTSIWLWAAITHFVGVLRPGDISDLMGIVGNYLKLALLVVLLYRDSPKTPHPTDPASPKSRNSQPPINERLIRRIIDTMETDRAFLDSQLTLERFADRVECPPRDVSAAINRRFHQNFHEFVSQYRMDDVKRQLRDPNHRDCSIADIAKSAGFNSKATFHRLFKKTEATTPSQYRKTHQTLAPRSTSTRTA